MSLFVNLRSVVYALSDALDLVGINDVYHGKRVGIMALEMARALGWSAESQERVFDVGLVHDIGVSSTDLHHHLVEEFDWEGSIAHAQLGAYLLDNFAPLQYLAQPIKYHHTHWSELRDDYDDDKRIANLIFLTDRVDVLAAVSMLNDSLLNDIPNIRQRIKEQSGEMFDPELVDVFWELSRKEAFWLALEPGAVRDYMGRMALQVQRSQTDFDTLRGVAKLFSHVVDTKSQFTVEHSEGVARVAHYLGECAGLGDEDCFKLEIAGYLHDLGKLRIPDAVLDKKGPLTDSERRLMASHAYETYRILSHIPGFEDIAQWAAFHHEIPDGEGYPFHLKGDELSLQARLLRAADIFQALAQDRPYRSALPARNVLELMHQLAEAGKLDGPIFEILQTHLEEIYRLARPKHEVAVPEGLR